MKRMMTVKMGDGSVWGVPVDVIARNRAEYYSHEFGGDIERSLTEDTIPLFESDNYEIIDWASNEMNWSDVETQAIKIEDAKTDFQVGWMNGNKEVIDVSA